MRNRTIGRVVIPRSPADLLALASKIYAKHISDGVASPLKAMVDFSWAEDGPKINPCLAKHVEAEEAAKKAEEAYRQRDVDIPAINAIVKNSAAVLKGIYAKNPKKMGEYGFTVDDSVQVKKVNPKV